ncbi:hypothetical protein K7432_016385, partial [Basidiobolus ranarum]
MIFTENFNNNFSTTLLSSPITLESYLGYLGQPALILPYTSHTSISAISFPILYVNSILLNLCGINKVSTTCNFHDLILPKYRHTISAWLQEVTSSSSPSKNTCTVHLYQQQSVDEVNNLHSERKPWPSRRGIRIEWSAVYIKQIAVVLTGIVHSTGGSVEVSNELEPVIMMPKGIVPQFENNTKEEKEEPSKLSNDSWKNVPELVRILSGGGFAGEMLRNYDWNNTPLGPIVKWPQSFLTAASLCMASTLPMAVWWGPKFTIIYNDSYRGVAGQKHPAMFGKQGQIHWAEIWDDIGPKAELAMQGTNSYVEDNLLFMTRKGYLEETYITWSYIPIRKEDGTVGGFLNPYIEVTKRIISERRLKTIRDIGTEAAEAKSANEVCSSIGNVLLKNPYDVPFAVMYTHAVIHTDSSDELYDSALKEKASPNLLRLVQSIGMPDSHPSLFSEIRLSHPVSSHPLQEAVRSAHSTRKIVVFNIDQVFGEVPIRGWEAPARQVAVSPIIGNYKDGVLVVVVMGLNHMREYDEDYETFIELVCRQTGSAIVSGSAYEEEVRRFRELAAIDQAKT